MRSEVKGGWLMGSGVWRGESRKRENKSGTAESTVCSVFWVVPAFLFPFYRYLPPSGGKDTLTERTDSQI